MNKGDRGPKIPLDDNVVFFPGATTQDYEPDQILALCMKLNLKHIIIVGVDDEDREVFKSSTADANEILWLLRRTEHKLMNLMDSYYGD